MSDSNSFVDSNVWLYTLLSDPKTEPQEEMRKRNQAIALLDRSSARAYANRLMGMSQ